MWKPRLSSGALHRFESLVQALSEDIAAGELQPGDRLPPQRDVAFQLRIGLGTVTRAYAEAERRGLIVAHTGRGSFVTSPSSTETVDGPLNFSRNLPPSEPARAHLSATLNTMRRQPDLLDYAPAAGRDRDRQAGQRWISDVTGWDGLRWQDVICCVGAQQAIALALQVAAPIGTPVVVEEATFWGFRALAAHTGRDLCPATIDEEGLRPDALERAVRASGARAAYVLPFHNPTARIMGLKRREAIAKVARKLDLMLIEDDLYAAFRHVDGPPPLASLAPERTFYINGVSKALAPGLRVGYLAAPPGSFFDRVLSAVRAEVYAPPAFGAVITTQWIEDGSAREILAAVKAEVRARVSLARDLLGDRMERPATGESLHIWLPMSELDAERVTSRALRLGVEPTPPSAPLVPGGRLSGLRLCIGGVSSLDELARGLKIIRGDDPGSSSVV